MNAKTSQTLENFGNAAKDVAMKAANGLKVFGANVADASKDLMNTAKLTSLKAQKQKDIDAAYRKLGELAYQKGGLTGDMAEVAQTIHSIYDELQKIEIELNAK